MRKYLLCRLEIHLLQLPHQKSMVPKAWGDLQVGNVLKHKWKRQQIKMLWRYIAVKQSSAVYSKHHWIKIWIHDQIYTQDQGKDKRRDKEDINHKVWNQSSHLHLFSVFLVCNSSQGWQSGKILTKPPLLPIIIPSNFCCRKSSELKTTGTWKMDRENKKLKIHLQKDWEGQLEKDTQTKLLVQK